MDATFEWSTDGGATFVPCTAAASSPTSNPVAGVVPGPVDFHWDTIADGVGTPVLTAGVIVGTQLDDGVAYPGGCTSAPFDVDNSAATCHGICGDCNLSGVGPDILDALTAAQIAAGLLTPSIGQLTCCDFNSSTSVDVLDALGIAQEAAGLPVTPNCP